jgi:SAM-dependent methyltransferase
VTSPIEFLRIFEERAPVFAKEARRTFEAEPVRFAEFAAPMLDWAEVTLGSGFEGRLIEGYCALVLDINRGQAEYEKSGHFLHSSYQEVHDATYASPAFMESYHWGVYTTMFVWRHHLALCAFYRDAFVEQLAGPAGTGSIVDLGCGSGLWHCLALRQLPGWSAVGVDISATSLDHTRRMTRQVMAGHEIGYVQADATTWQPAEEFDAGISSFLLEHLEDPASLLANLCRCLKPGGLAYVSCGLTAAQIDHIYEFKRESEVVAMAESAGFRVIQAFSSAPSRVLPNRRYLPRSMGLVLQRRKAELW